MTVRKIYTVWCDLPPEKHPQTPMGGTCTGWVSQERSELFARAEAAEAGWIIGLGEHPDYCPAAAESLHSTGPANASRPHVPEGIRHD